MVSLSVFCVGTVSGGSFEVVNSMMPCLFKHHFSIVWPLFLKFTSPPVHWSKRCHMVVSRIISLIGLLGSVNWFRNCFVSSTKAIMVLCQAVSPGPVIVQPADSFSNVFISEILTKFHSEHALPEP